MEAGVLNKIDDAARRMYDRIEHLDGVNGAITLVLGQGGHVHGHVSGRPEYAAVLVSLCDLFNVECERMIGSDGRFRVGEIDSN